MTIKRQAGRRNAEYLAQDEKETFPMLPTYTAFISRFIYILASANLSHHLLAPTKGVKFKSKEGVQAFWNRVRKLTNSSILACILSMNI